MPNLQFRFGNYEFKPSLTGLLVLLICIPLFIKLGLWQYGKAEQKQLLQSRYDSLQYAREEPLPVLIKTPEDWRYKPVVAQGQYLADYQILLDNQVEGEQAGYHVVTPFKISGREEVVLVNRGWIPASGNHSEVPAVTVPAGELTIHGRGWLPGQKFYSLGKPEQEAPLKWRVVWQNMDMQAYQQAVPYKVLPVLIRLAPEDADGFVRNWVMPAERITTHIGYAYQWFGFALAAMAIYIFVSIKKVAGNGGRTD